MAGQLTNEFADHNVKSNIRDPIKITSQLEEQENMLCNKKKWIITNGNRNATDNRIRRQKFKAGIRTILHMLKKKIEESMHFRSDM